jgi:hypothetical protein
MLNEAKHLPQVIGAKLRMAEDISGLREVLKEEETGSPTGEPPAPTERKPAENSNSANGAQRPPKHSRLPGELYTFRFRRQYSRFSLFTSSLRVFSAQCSMMSLNFMN